VRRQKIKDQKGLWIMTFFREIAYALVTVLSSIFIFSIGRESFWGGGIRGGLLLVVLFLLIVRLVVVGGIVGIGNKIIRRIGYRRTLLLSLGLSTGAFLLLAQASVTGNLWYVMMAGTLYGLVICTFWVTYFTLFSEEAVEEKVGAEFGRLDAMAKLGQVAAPFLGALIASRVGYEYMFGVAVIFLVLAGLPALFLKHHLHLDEVSWREFLDWTSEWTFVKAGIAMGGRLIHDSLYIDFWPIYVLLVVGSIERMGVFGSVTALATVMFTYLVAKLADKPNMRKFQVLGAVGGAVMWGARLWVKNLTQIVVIDSVDKFFSTTSRNFFFGYAFKRAKGPETFSFVVYWLLWQSIWTILALLLLALILIWWDGSFWVVVASIGAGGILLSTLIEEHHRKQK